MSFDEQSVRGYIDYVEDRIDTEAINGMLTKEEAGAIQVTLSEAAVAVTTDLSKANDLAHQAWFEFVSYLNKRPARYRLLYVYAVPIWILLVALTVSLLIVIYAGILGYPIFSGISGDVIAWGGLGGCGYSIYHLRDDVASYNLSKYQAIYWSVYPFAGMIFGLAIVFIIASGLLSLGAAPTYAVYATIAFLAGLFQQWVLATLKDVSEAIHKTEQ